MTIDLDRRDRIGRSLRRAAPLHPSAYLPTRIPERNLILDAFSGDRAEPDSSHTGHPITSISRVAATIRDLHPCFDGVTPWVGAGRTAFLDRHGKRYEVVQ